MSKRNPSGVTSVHASPPASAKASIISLHPPTHTKFEVRSTSATYKFCSGRSVAHSLSWVVWVEDTRNIPAWVPMHLQPCARPKSRRARSHHQNLYLFILLIETMVRPRKSSQFSEAPRATDHHGWRVSWALINNTTTVERSLSPLTTDRLLGTTLKDSKLKLLS